MAFEWMLILWSAAAPAAAREAEDLALGKKVVFAPAPNYALTARGGTDAVDLTDGKLSSRKDNRLWFDSAAVGWSYAGLAQMAVDLGSPSDVGEVAMRWQGGSPQAGITVPCRIDVLASEDGRRYRLVASCSRFRGGDRRKFAIPPDEGEAWVHTLRFRDVNVRARFIGVEIYGAGLSVSDELKVLAAPAGTKCLSASLRGRPAAFAVTAPRMYFHKPVVHVPTNVSAPTPVGWIVPAGCEKTRVTATIDLPKGVRFIGGRFGGTDLPEAKGEPVEGGAYSRYTFAFHAGKGDKAWRRIYLAGGAPGGGSIRH
ncbi:MAG: hypothetical protein WBF17_28760, partial [Phycisphaerae bacterium]